MFYTTSETARLLRLKPQTLAKWRCNRSCPDLSWIKIGTKVLYSEESIKRFIEMSKH
ncbi:helix-turn-helix domain-containing protein [Vibrio diabolicus]|uniref:helix-turn-helix domain-containing protein n=1 Tax=Vibrio diabolicus TaxID=50719 RepID=UPI003BF91988